MRFESCARQTCVAVSILNDTQVEIDEVFYITLERTPELNEEIKLNPVDGQIQIMENDCKLWLVYSAY